MRATYSKGLITLTVNVSRETSEEKVEETVEETTENVSRETITFV